MDITDPQVANQLDRRALIAGIGGLAAGATLFARNAKAGPLTPPPGPIGSTGRTVQDIYDKIARTDAGLAEPRIPVQSLPGSATAVHVISQPGSYYLSTNLIGESGKSGIEISSENVCLDLGGHQMIGVPGSIHAISAIGGFATLRNVRIHNGSIRLWGGSGVAGRALSDSIVRHLSVDECTFDGSIPDRSNVVLARRGTIVDVKASGGTGIGCLEGAFVMGCQQLGGSGGIFVADAGLVIASRVLGAEEAFVIQGTGSIIECLATSSGSGFVGSSLHITRCHAVSCSAGYRLGGQTRIDECSAVECQTGVDSFGPNLGAVVTRTTFSNCAQIIAPGALVAYGPLVNVSAGGDIAAIPGTDHPWANFVF